MMRILLRNLILMLLAVAFFSSCAVPLNTGSRHNVKRVYHKRKKAKDCGCELMVKKDKTYFVA
jgi:Mg2+/Co2+ transporter CorB